MPTYFTLDLAGTILAVTEPGIYELGLEPNAVIGCSFSELVVESQRESVQQQLLAIAASSKLEDLAPFAIHSPQDNSLRFAKGQLHWLQSGSSVSMLLVCEPCPSSLENGEVAADSQQLSLQAALESAQIGVWSWSMQSDQLRVSTSLARMLQRSDSTEPLTLHKALNCVHEDDRLILQQTIRQAVIDACDYSLECRVFRGDGVLRWLGIRGRVCYDSEGKLAEVIGVALDITKRKRAEEALRQQIDREQLVAAITQHIRRSLNLKQILETTVTEVRHVLQTDRVLIFRFDENRNGTVIVESVGDGWMSLLGTTQDHCFTDSQSQLYAQGHTSVVDNIHTANLASSYTDRMVSYGVHSALTVPILQAEMLWGLLIVHHCHNPRKWLTIEVELLEKLAAQVEIAIEQSELYQQVQRLNADLERQVQIRTAELQLAFEFEATLKRITDRVRDSLDEHQILQTAVRELAIALGVTGCNASLYDLEMRTSTICYEYTDTLAPFQGRIVQMANFLEGYNQLLRGQFFQFCSLIPNPVRGRVAMLACPMLDNQGVLGDLWLISQQYRSFSEQDIRLVQQVSNQCAIAIRQARLYQKAQAQVEALEQLNRLKDDFLSTVSHELRTPISNIKLAIQMLDINLRRMNLLGDETSPGGLSKYFQILNDECRREITLINDLLDLSRLESGAEPPCLTVISLQTWVPKLVQPFMERATSQGQQIQIDVPSNLPAVTTDVSRLERILSELLNNACKYTPRGETITVTAAIDGLRNQAAPIPEAVDDLMLNLSVSNSGVEILPNELERIFDKFYRIPNNDPWKHGGTGLGLALVQKLTETLGGTVQVTSSQLVTCFMLELPLSVAEQGQRLIAAGNPG
jgi:PAS domain S-box-containing protein